MDSPRPTNRCSGRSLIRRARSCRRTIRLARLPPATASSIARGLDAGTALAVSGDGVANLMLRTTAGDLRLLRLRRGPDAAVVLPVDFGRRGVDVRRMRAFPGNRLLVLGTIGEEPLAAVMALDGKVVMRYQLPQQLDVVNAVVEPDGGLVIVCTKGELLKETSWVGRLSPAGAVVATKEFAGRPADVARGSDGTTLVLIETNGTAIAAKGLGPALTEQWTRTLVSGLPVPGASFHAAAVPSGGFAVSGTKNRALWVARLKADGSEVWADTTDPATSPELEMALHVELPSAGPVFAVAYSAMILVGRERHSLVRAFRFTVN